MKLSNVIDLVGHTDNNILDMISLIKNAKGILCPITGAMHIAAVFNTPCVYIGGAREPIEYITYDIDTHIFINSNGMLKCCKNGVCEYLGKAYNNNCNDIASDGSCMCMHIIKPDTVINAINKLNK